jgi:hypothetical protein
VIVKSVCIPVVIWAIMGSTGCNSWHPLRSQEALEFASSEKYSVESDVLESESVSSKGSYVTQFVHQRRS